MKQKAQAAIEVLIVAFVVLLLLLLGILVTVQYNFVSNQLLTASTGNIECNKIADEISEIYSQQKIAQKNIFISQEVTIQRTGTNPGTVIIGSPVENKSYCYYFGRTKKCANPPACADPPTCTCTACTGFTLDCTTTASPIGFTLEKGVTYKISRGSDGFVVFAKLS